MWLRGNTVGKERTISFIFYMLSFAAVAFYMPNFVLFYRGLGFNGIQIGILAGIAPLITLLGAPVWTGLADKKSRHRPIMSLVLLATVLVATIFPMMQTFMPIVVLVGLFAIFSAPIPAFADSATMFMLAGRKELYGRVRLGGTIGFGLAAILSSLLIRSYGISWIFWGYAVMMFLAFIVSLRFRYASRGDDESLKWNLGWVLTSRRWILFLMMAFIGGVAFTTINNYMLPYMQELGASRMTMGFALTISTMGELPVLFFSNLLLKRFKAYGLFIFGLTITGVRLLLLAVFNFTAGILFFQLLNGLTFPLMWVAGVTYADENAPPGMKSTAQGLFGAMILGIGAAVGGMCGGLMLESIGGRNMYWIFGCLVLVCVGVITVFERAERGREARNNI